MENCGYFFPGDFQEMSVRAFSEMTFYWRWLGGAWANEPRPSCGMIYSLMPCSCGKRLPKSITLLHRFRRCCCLKTISNSDRKRPPYFSWLRHSLPWYRGQKHGLYSEGCSGVIPTTLWLRTSWRVVSRYGQLAAWNCRIEPSHFERLFSFP